MKKLFVVSLLILSLGLLYISCDKDDECDVPELPGTWMAIEEEADLSAYNFGKMNLLPGSDMFINLIVTLQDGGTCTYETWNGPKTAAEAKTDTLTKYDAGNGTWSAENGIFNLTMPENTYEGSYEQQCDKLIINTVLTEELMGAELTFPAVITMQKQ